MFQDLTQTFEESAPRAAGADDREIFAQYNEGGKVQPPCKLLQQKCVKEELFQVQAECVI